MHGEDELKRAMSLPLSSRQASLLLLLLLRLSAAASVVQALRPHQYEAVYGEREKQGDREREFAMSSVRVV